MRGGETDVGAASIVWPAQVREPRLPVRMHQLEKENITSHINKDFIIQSRSQYVNFRNESDL